MSKWSLYHSILCVKPPEIVHKLFTYIYIYTHIHIDINSEVTVDQSRSTHVPNLKPISSRCCANITLMRICGMWGHIDLWPPKSNQFRASVTAVAQTKRHDNAPILIAYLNRRMQSRWTVLQSDPVGPLRGVWQRPTSVLSQWGLIELSAVSFHIKGCDYLRIENGEGNVLIAVYLYVCVRVIRISQKVANRISWNLVGWLVIIRGPFD